MPRAEPELNIIATGDPVPIRRALSQRALHQHCMDRMLEINAGTQAVMDCGRGASLFDPMTVKNLSTRLQEISKDPESNVAQYLNRVEPFFKGFDSNKYKSI